MEHTRNYYLKKIILSQLIDVSSISCTINYTHMSPIRELSLGGVSNCIEIVSIESLNLDSFKNQVSAIEIFLTVSKPMTVTKSYTD
jgi:hypothetical protein